MATSGGLLATCGVPPLATPHATAGLRLIAFSQASSKRCGLLPGRAAYAFAPPGPRATSSMGHAVRTLLDASEFVEVTKLTPLRHDEVAVFVNRSAVRRVADAVLPLVLWQAEVGALVGIGIIADLRDDILVLVLVGVPPLQLWKHVVIASNMLGGRYDHVPVDRL